MLQLGRLTAKAAPQLARLAPRIAPAAQHFHAGIPARKEEKEVTEPEGKILLTPGTLVDKLGLDDWKRALPVGLILAIPALSQEWIVLNEETQLLGCFMFFVGTVYTKFGDSIGASLDAQADAILETRNKQEDIGIDMLKEEIHYHQQRLSMADNISAINDLQRELMQKEAKLQTLMAPHATREVTLAMLDNMVAVQSSEWNAKQEELVTSAVNKVSEQVRSDKKLKKTALDEALVALADPSKAPATDAVSSLFTQFFKDTGAHAQKELTQVKTVTPEERKALLEHIEAQVSRFSMVEGIKEQAEAAKKLIPAKYTGSLKLEFLKAQAKARGISV